VLFLLGLLAPNKNGFKVSPTGKIIRGAKVNQQFATSA
jgi:hypothetical protein